MSLGICWNCRASGQKRNKAEFGVLENCYVIFIFLAVLPKFHLQVVGQSSGRGLERWRGPCRLYQVERKTQRKRMGWNVCMEWSYSGALLRSAPRMCAGERMCSFTRCWRYEWSISFFGRFTLGKEPSILFVWEAVSTRDQVCTVVAKSRIPAWESNPGHSARSQSL
jgi:hypothetical protein